jgi:FKBP-type peptidyl-prolyl cis-trans isomerase FklB
MRRIFLLGIVLVMFSSCNIFRRAEKGDKQTLNTPMERFSYALGMSIGENFLEAGLDSVETDFLLKGINDMIKQREKLLAPEEAAMVIQEFIGKAEQRKSEVNREVEQKFFEQNKKREGIKTTETGLQYEIIEQGNGPKPTIVDQVTVHYHGTLIDGTVFDSSVDRSEPMTFPVTSVIPGMQEAILMMPVGSKWRLYVPSSLAYGETGAGGVIDPYAPLIFEVELIKIE